MKRRYKIFLNFVKLAAHLSCTGYYILAISLFPSQLSASLSQFNWLVLYLIGLVIIAPLIGYHAIITLRHKGKTPESFIFALTSLLEGVWLLVSGLLLYYGEFSKLTYPLKAAPTAYIVYCVFGWIYGLYLLKDEADNIKNVDDIVMPTAYLQYSKGFAVIMTLTALMMLGWLWQKGEFVLPF